MSITVFSLSDWSIWELCTRLQRRIHSLRGGRGVVREKGNPGEDWDWEYFRAPVYVCLRCCLIDKQPFNMFVIMCFTIKKLRLLAFTQEQQKKIISL